MTYRSLFQFCRVKANLFHDTLQDCVKPSGTNILNCLIQLGRHAGHFPDGFLFELKFDTLRPNELYLLAKKL